MARTDDAVTHMARAALASAERDRALKHKDWAAAADLSDELAELFTHHPKVSHGYHHAAMLFRQRADSEGVK